MYITSRSSAVVVVRPLCVRPVVSRHRPLSVRPSHHPSRRPSHCRRCPSSVPPFTSVRPSVRRRPFSVRPRPSVVVVPPLSVRPVVRLIITYKTSHSIRRMGKGAPNLDMLFWFD